MGNILLIYRTNCTLSRTKKHAIRCLEKKCTFCEPCMIHKMHGLFQTAPLNIRDILTDQSVRRDMR